MSDFLQATIYDEPALRLTACVAWGDELACGTAEGLLLHFAPATLGGPPVLTQRCKVSAQHAVVQLAAAASCGIIVLLLADGSLATHALPSLKPCAAVLRKGVETSHMALAGVGGRAKLAATGKSKLQLFFWRGGAGASDGAFEVVAELKLPEPVRFLAWGGETQLWCAFKQRYARIHGATHSSPSLQIAEVLPIGGKPGAVTPLGAHLGPSAVVAGPRPVAERPAAAAVCPTPGCEYLVTWHATHCCANCAHGKAHGIWCSRKPAPPAPQGLPHEGLCLPAGGAGPAAASSRPGGSGDMVLLSQNMGVFVDATGRPARGYSLSFAEPPLALAPCASCSRAAPCLAAP